jgi:hypothetical protein
MCNLSLQHAIVLNLDAATGTSFFGVYDGHGGPIFTLILLNKFQMHDAKRQTNV